LSVLQTSTIEREEKEMTIKRIKAMHWVWRDYQWIAEKARHEQDPRIQLLAERGSFLGKDHYYYVKGNEIKSLVNIPEGMSGIIHDEHWELCNPRKYFARVEQADNFVRACFSDTDIEEIDHSDKCLDQDDIREMFGIPEK
jgi:hypothetical protein